MGTFPGDAALTTITIVPDTRVRLGGRAGVRGDSEYVEAVYLQLLGARQILLYRRFLRELMASGQSVQLSLEELAQSFALPPGAITRTLKRLVDWGIIRWSDGIFQVPGLLPVLPDRTLTRLSASARSVHERTVQSLGCAS